MVNDKIRGRFAPSPSGEMHLGNAGTALLAWLQVRSQRGTMVLRMEDLDPDRSRKHYAAQIMADLNWLGLDWDEGPDCGGPYRPYTQDERRGLYQRYLDSLTAQGIIYPCYCTRAEIMAAASAPHEGEAVYPGTCRKLAAGELAARQSVRKPALRLIVPDEVIEFQDGVYGNVVQNLTKECGDFTVLRSDGVHAYQLAVVVDDATMAITHVLRGDDLLSSTPRQIYLFRLLGFQPPEFTHVPLLCSPDGYRLSKRQKALSLAALAGRGVSPQEITGYLAFKAGLIEKREPVAAKELINEYSQAKLRPGKVIVEESDLDKGC